MRCANIPGLHCPGNLVQTAVEYLSFPVVRTPRENVGGTIELLPQHQADQQMGKSHRAQGEALIRPVDKIRIQTQVTSDSEENSLGTPTFEAPEPIGESDAVPTSASFVESYQPPTGFAVAKNQLGLET